MRCIAQGLVIKTFVAYGLPNPVEQKSYDVINNKLPLVMKEVAEESMKRAAVEENSSLSDNLLTVSGDGTWKTRGHSSLIGECTVIGAEIGKVLDREVLSSFCKGCDSYKGKFDLKINQNVCVSLAERDNRRIFTSRRGLASSFEARRAKKIIKAKEIELFKQQESISYDPGAF
ncbi:uncharacterized protein TNIN_130781 [Trichonephila inaurata madagascariensis]|uniref:Mutator-like transposase domain-containing protein n=1 Tax=Trichonephila inaurata madagascariensis TaxID=2747483 RepID=A0A8X6MEI7_9ARAC|nr:uncharacterized protein TNIN_130781 [Trichonephila inaurata madagascariensis]